VEDGKVEQPNRGSLPNGSRASVLCGAA